MRRLRTARPNARPLLAALLAVSVAACGRSDADESRLVVYAAGPRSVVDAVTQAFAEAHGARVELYSATTGQIMARLEAERFRPRADVVILAGRTAAEGLREAGRLLPYPDPPWLDLTRSEWNDPAGHFFATSAALVGIALRDAPEEPDLSERIDWADVFGGRIGGRLTLPAPSRSGASGDFVIAYTLREGEAAWDGYLNARRAGLEISAANSQAISGLLVGAYDGIVGAVDYLIFAQIAGGAPLRMHFPPSGAVLVERPIAILAGTRNPELARAFVDFYFTEEAQRWNAGAHLLPARLDVPVSDVRRAATGGTELPPLIEVDQARVLSEQARILRRFQLEVERAEVVRDRR